MQQKKDWSKVIKNWRYYFDFTLEYIMCNMNSFVFSWIAQQILQSCWTGNDKANKVFNYVACFQRVRGETVYL